MSGIVELLLAALALPVITVALYLLVLTLLSAAVPPPLAPPRLIHFDIVVPAHDEAAGIAAVVASLRALDWPPALFRVLVVADNCSDATAELARAAGAAVIERQDGLRRGKGYALQAGFEASRDRGFADAVVVVDADSVVTPNLLVAFAARLHAGAGAVQAHYAVLNAQDSWRTRLMAIAMAAFHQLRSRGRERLALSCGLRGNGWCVTHRLLRAVPYAAFSLAEDVEYGLAIGEAGARVHYADEAVVSAAMVADEAGSRTQRLRWEEGRRALARQRAGPLLAAALRRGDPVLRDLALDLIVPPLSQAAIGCFAFVLLAALATAWDDALWPWFATALVCALALSAYVVRGWQLSGTGLRGALDLARAPAFVVWKSLLRLRSSGGAQWVRTRREKP